MFNTIISNPPYKQGLHLDFIEKAIDCASDTVMFIHPSEWLIHKKLSTGKRYKDLRYKSSNGNRVSAELIDNVFDIHLFLPLSITYITKNSSGVYFQDSRTFVDKTECKINGKKYQVDLQSRGLEKLDDIEHISAWGYGKVINEIMKKISYHRNSWKYRLKKNYGKHYINLISATAGSYTRFNDDVCVSNMFSVITQDSMFVDDKIHNAQKMYGKELEKHWFAFKTYEEAENALNFIAYTKFMRVYLAIIKYNHHAADNLLTVIPWFDWTEKWDDNRLNKYFKFTEEEIDVINRIFDVISFKVKKNENKYNNV